jgi:Protein of unknown function (DUF1573)
MKKLLIIFLLLCQSLVFGELVFDETSQTLNVPPDAKIITGDFYFENKGSTEVVIKTYESTCTCMTVQISNQGKLRYAPGEKGVVRGVFNMENFSGEVDKTILISMEGDPANQPNHKLTLHVHIPVLVKIEPKTLIWNPEEERNTKIIRVKMAHTEPISIQKVSCTNGSFTTQFTTIEVGKLYEISVTPVEKEKSSTGLGVIHIETDCKIEKQRTQIAFATMPRNKPEDIQTSSPLAPTVIREK